MHFRRGDYVNITLPGRAPFSFPLPAPFYYAQCADLLAAGSRGELTFFVFTQDWAWARAQARAGALVWDLRLDGVIVNAQPAPLACNEDVFHALQWCRADNAQTASRVARAPATVWAERRGEMPARYSASQT